MGRDQHLHEVQRSESGRDVVHTGSTPTEDLTWEELQIESAQQLTALIQLYHQQTVPRLDTQEFIHHLTERRDSWFVRINDIGLVFFTHIVPNHSGVVHVLFWDRKIQKQSRAQVVRHITDEAMKLFGLIRVGAITPSPGLRDLFIKAGFDLEGVARKALLVNGIPQDVYCLGLVSEVVNATSHNH